MPFKAILEQVTINRLPGSGPLANGDNHLAICERHASRGIQSRLTCL